MDYHGPENRECLKTELSFGLAHSTSITASAQARDVPGQAVYRRATESGWISGSFEVKKRRENR